MKTVIRKELGYMLFLFVSIAPAIFAMNYALMNWVWPSIHSGMQISDCYQVSVQFFLLFLMFMSIITPLNLLADFFATWTIIPFAWIYYRFR